MQWDLRGVAGCDQGAHGDQASVAGMQSHAKPQVPKQYLGRVSDERWRGRAELGFDARDAVSFKSDVQRQTIPGRQGKADGLDSAILEYRQND